jgi:hypothetical protein
MKKRSRLEGEVALVKRVDDVATQAVGLASRRGATKSSRQTANITALLLHALRDCRTDLLGALHGAARQAADANGLLLPFAWLDEGELALRLYDNLAKLTLAGDRTDLIHSFARLVFDAADQALGFQGARGGKDPRLFLERSFFIRTDTERPNEGRWSRQGRCGLRLDRARESSRVRFDTDADVLNAVELVGALNGLELDRAKLGTALRVRQHRSGSRSRRHRDG